MVARYAPRVVLPAEMDVRGTLATIELGVPNEYDKIFRISTDLIT